MQGARLRGIFAVVQRQCAKGLRESPLSLSEGLRLLPLRRSVSLFTRAHCCGTLQRWAWIGGVQRISTAKSDHCRFFCRFYAGRRCSYKAGDTSTQITAPTARLPAQDALRLCEEASTTRLCE